MIKGTSNSDSDDVLLGNLVFSPNASTPIPPLPSRPPTALGSPPHNPPPSAFSRPRVNELRQDFEPRVIEPRAPNSKDFKQHHRRLATLPDQPIPATFQGAARILTRSATDPSAVEPHPDFLEPVTRFDLTPQPHKPFVPSPALKSQDFIDEPGRAVPTAASAPSTSVSKGQGSLLQKRGSSRRYHRLTGSPSGRTHQELIQDINQLIAESATISSDVEGDYGLSNQGRDSSQAFHRLSQVPPPLSISVNSQRTNKLLASSVFDSNSRESSPSSLYREQEASKSAGSALSLTARSNLQIWSETNPRPSKTKQASHTRADNAFKPTVDSLNTTDKEDSRHSLDSEQDCESKTSQVNMAAIRASTFFDPSFERFSRLPESQRFTRNEAKQQEAIIHAKLKNAGVPIPPYEFINFIGKGTYGRVYSA